jgi:hypothetical protein
LQWGIPEIDIPGDFLANLAFAIIKDTLNQIIEKYVDGLSDSGAMTDEELRHRVMVDGRILDPKSILIIRPKFTLKFFRAENPETVARKKLESIRNQFVERGASPFKIEKALKLLDQGILMLNIRDMREKNGWADVPLNLRQVADFYEAFKDKLRYIHFPYQLYERDFRSYFNYEDQSPEVSDKPLIPNVEVNFYGIKKLKEKGVDTSLVIAVMDDLHARRFDQYCLLTNDTDMDPLFERLFDQGEDVYFISLAGKRTSHAIKDKLPADRVIAPRFQDNVRAFAERLSADLQISANDLAMAAQVEELNAINTVAYMDMDSAWGLDPEELE